MYFTGGIGQEKLYRNIGNGQFQDVSVQSGIAAMNLGETFGVISGDIDNDGYRDILVTTYWNSGTAVLRNQGNGTFVLVPNALNDVENWKTAASFADVNKDGFLDVYLTSYVFNSGVVFDGNNEIVGFDYDCNLNQLFINNGNLTFAEASSS